MNSYPCVIQFNRYSVLLRKEKSFNSSVNRGTEKEVCTQKVISKKKYLS